MNNKLKKLEAEISNKKYQVKASIKAKNIQRNPYAPFTTSTLQQDAAIKLGFTTKKNYANSAKTL